MTELLASERCQDATRIRRPQPGIVLQRHAIAATCSYQAAREQHRLGSTATQHLRDRCGEQTTNALQEQHR